MFFSSKPNHTYIIINDPIHLVNIVKSLDKKDQQLYLTGNLITDRALLKKAKSMSGKMPANNNDILTVISQKFENYQKDINSVLKHHLSIDRKHFNDYDIKRMDEAFKTLDYYKKLVNKEIFLTYRASYSVYYELLISLMYISDVARTLKKTKF